MIIPNIDAVERYTKRIEDYVNDKSNQKSLYSSTINRLVVVRNILAKTLRKLDSILESNHKELSKDECSIVTSSKDVVQSYKKMFDEYVDTGYYLVDKTVNILHQWYKKKILSFHEIQKVDPRKTYNVSWIPMYIRDFVIYLCSDNNVESRITKIESFLNVDNSNNQFTCMVPYDVAKIGIEKSRDPITHEAEALWMELYENLFSNLSLPQDSRCYCSSSLIDTAFSNTGCTSEEITDEFISATFWVHNYQRKEGESYEVQ